MSNQEHVPLINGDGERICRNCLSSEEPEDLISPCSCSGSVQWVHRSCLDTWRAVSQNPESFYACDICKFHYLFEEALEENKEGGGGCSSCLPCGSEGRAKTLFSFLILRDFVVVLLVWQLFVFASGGIVYGIDASSNDFFRNLIFPETTNVVLVYWVLGLLGFFFFMGIFSLFFACCTSCSFGKEEEYEYNTYRYRRYHDDGTFCLFFWYPTFYYGPGPGPDCSNCDCCCSNCHHASAISSVNVGGGGKDGLTVLVVILLVIIVIFIVIGMVASIIFVVMYGAYVTKKHASVLYKKTAAKFSTVVDFSKKPHLYPLNP